MKNIITVFSLLICALLLIQCGKKEETATQKNDDKNVNNTEKQLNITFLLDLSDRIEPTKYPEAPEHFERDQAIVKDFVDYFKNDMEKRGGYKAKGKMKVIFSPQPSDQNINKIASEINIDLSKMKPQEKKNVFTTIDQKFSGNLAEIYKLTLSQKNYIGSDVWRFFKNDVIDYAISDNPDYRNILVIITDGYLYHKDSKSNDKNRTTYLTPESITQNGFRTNNWKQKFDAGDYGFITSTKDLQNLEILVLEVNPEKNSLKDEDIVKAYLSKWFDEMGVKKYEIYNSDLPVNTKSRIEKFLNN
ncbi:hypothetical protein SAMN05660477_02767 [Soonwooa buanensis]|uniref:VWFA domain-containing protein n=1 Tax=Soonwooa buanensis TaxID=619805 RepID=A0A1T5GDX3_9FLAO|nr:hypothetical protein [Soonwooa buanensis]SKC06616.1 hypothetical protein SAMN05660477_02767 [Soonwooa buanensis]